MEKREYLVMYNIEKEYWWYSGMREIIKKYLSGKYEWILDAGCGTGINIKLLEGYGENTVGLDFYWPALELSKKRGIKNLIQGSVEKLPFKNEVFDVVTSFEVIYHKDVSDDLKAIEEMYRVCKKNGKLIIRVPAFKILKSEHDKAVHGIRRYTKKELKSKLERAGFKIERITYLNSFLFVPILVMRLLKKSDKKEAKSDLKKLPKIINSLLKNLLILEGRISKNVSLPFGVSLICVCRK